MGGMLSTPSRSSARGDKIEFAGSPLDRLPRAAGVKKKHARVPTTPQSGSYGEVGELPCL